MGKGVGLPLAYGWLRDPGVGLGESEWQSWRYMVWKCMINKICRLHYPSTLTIFINRSMSRVSVSGCVPATCYFPQLACKLPPVYFICKYKKSSFTFLDKTNTEIKSMFRWNDFGRVDHYFDGAPKSSYGTFVETSRRRATDASLPS